MKTEVTKKYKSGFFLSEVELRRLVQTCNDSFLKEWKSEEMNFNIFITLKDGSIITTKIIDDIFSLENTGSKQIKKIELQYKTKQEYSDCLIYILFKNASEDPDSWISISSTIIGTSRDWTFLTSAEIEERIKKIKKISIPAISNKRFLMIIPVIISFCIILMFSFVHKNEAVPVDILEKAYLNGTLQNPIEAIILLEKAKNKQNDFLNLTLPLLLSYVIPWVLFFALLAIAGFVFPSYNFYWGDYVSFYDKRKIAKNIFWTVIVLGIIVSIISNYIVKLLP